MCVCTHACVCVCCVQVCRGQRIISGVAQRWPTFLLKQGPLPDLASWDRVTGQQGPGIYVFLPPHCCDTRARHYVWLFHVGARGVCVKLRSYAYKASALMMEPPRASFLGGTGQHSSRCPICPQSIPMNFGPSLLEHSGESCPRKFRVHYCAPLTW